MQRNVAALTLTTANTEYSWTPPAGCRAVRLQARGSVDLRVAVVSGKVAGSTDPYFTIKSGTVWEDARPSLGICFDTKLYFASGTNSTVVEIVYFT